MTSPTNQLERERDSADTAHLISLMRLASPALPIGGFSYSQGLETAIEHGWIRDEDSAARWIGDLLAMNLGRFEAPLLHALCEAVAGDRFDEADRLHDMYLASRETSELRAETLQMGYSLRALIDGLPERERLGAWPAHLGPSQPDATALPLSWALAARVFALPAQSATLAYLWAWAENQVMAAIKAVPLGQQAGQRILSKLTAPLHRAALRAVTLPSSEWSNFATGFALASSWHEAQYTRLFRS